MDKNGKLTWYEVAVDIVPDKKNMRHNYFYVSVCKWEEWEEFGNMRYNYNPFEGEYSNRREFFERTRGRDDIKHVTIADTLMDKQSALELEEYLVKGFRSCDPENGFNKKAGE